MARPSAKQSSSRDAYGLCRHPWDIPRTEGQYVETSPRITDQSAKDRCDVNNIIATYHQTGILPGYATRKPQYGDMPEQSFFESACIVAEAASAAEQASMNPDPQVQGENASEDATERSEASPEPEAAPQPAGEPDTATSLTNEGA